MEGVEDSDRELRFDAYVEELAATLRHADRKQPFRNYVTGLLLPGERKSVEPMAALIAPLRASAEHQSLLTFVSDSAWDDIAFLDVVTERVLPVVTGAGEDTVWIVDDTGFPKKGEHSVGVARQYCGQVGKKENCQIAVTLSIATERASLPVAYRLYLPEQWAEDEERRKKTKIPIDIGFKTKPEIALEQIWDAVARGVAPGTVLADPAYGNNTIFRDNITALGLKYSVGIQSTTTVWAPGTGPLPPLPWSGHGRPPTAWRRDEDHQPVAVKELALGLAADNWQRVFWREGTNERLSSRFARVRVRPAHADHKRSEPRPEEWLLIEWPENEAAPTKYWLSTLPESMTIEEMVRITKMRWRIERDYRELKQELGLGHYEGRGWRGFHHHASLCIAAYGFLIIERIAFPPCADRRALGLKKPAVPTSYRPRGAAGAARAA